MTDVYICHINEVKTYKTETQKHTPERIIRLDFN